MSCHIKLMWQTFDRDRVLAKWAISNLIGGSIDTIVSLSERTIGSHGRRLVQSGPNSQREF